ncbi:MAG: hypothetical protein Q9P90_01085 [candidate division KSB1 bacterium]|nr:hypothetical protein [candidate division KSB1 bacterium]
MRRWWQWPRVWLCGWVGLLVWLPAAAFPQADIRLQVSGYAKSLAVQSKSLFTGQNYFYDLSRFRAKGQVYVGNAFQLEGWLDTEMHAGDFLETLDFKFGQLLRPARFFDLDWDVVTENRLQVQQRLFRLFATAYIRDVQITVGRQRIAWGTGFAWNPTDLLNPYNPFAIEREEKDGVDALYVAVPLGALSRLEAAVAPGKSGMKPRSAVRWHANAHGVDFSLMGGRFQGKWLLGGDLVAYMGGAAIRAEWAYTVQPDRGDYWRFVANWDYNFSNGIYTLVEYYFNGRGTSQKEEYNLLALLTGEPFGLARHYVAALASKDLTPLFKLEWYAIANLNDRSALWGPAVTYSLTENLEILFSAYLFAGAEDSELGGLNNAYFASLQYYF